MSVYVDEPVWPFGRMMMCHMLADNEEELHAMARRIGVLRRWFQSKRFPHYDVCKSKRALAVRFGAVEISRETFVQLARVQEIAKGISDYYETGRPILARPDETE